MIYVKKKNNMYEVKSFLKYSNHFNFREGLCSRKKKIIFGRDRLTEMGA